MKLKEGFFYTLREDIKDEETTSGKLLVRSGMIKKTMNGVYTFMVSEATSISVENADPAPVAVTPVAGKANPFAYGLKSEFAGGVLKASFSLNTDATAVTLKVRNAAGDVIATAEGATTKGAQTVSVNLVEFDGENCTWEVEWQVQKRLQWKNLHNQCSIIHVV